MGEIEIEYDNMTPDELIKAIRHIAHEEGLEEELKKAGDEHNIWQPNVDKNLAKLENWVTQKIYEPLEGFRIYILQYIFKELQEKQEIEPIKEIVQFLEKTEIKPSADLIFPRDAVTAMVVKPFFYGKIAAQVGDEAGHFIDTIKLPNESSKEFKIRLPKIYVGAEIVKKIGLSKEEQESVKWAEKAAGLKLTQWAHTIRDEVRYEVAQATRKKFTPKQLQARLNQKFISYAVDLRRIALTEINDAFNTGYLMSIPKGTIVKGVSAPDACSFCREHINGKQYEVAHEPKKDGWKYVWPSKSNYGRKREEWWPAIPSHPNCRCRWIQISNKKGDTQNE